MERKVRDSNLELYRIIVMLLIVAHHYFVSSGLMFHLNDALNEGCLVGDDMTKALAFFAFGAWGKTGINCFVLITGYFMCTSAITLRKFLKMLFQIIFYNVIINAAFAITGYTSFRPDDILAWLIPMRHVHSNYFVDCFVLFWLLIPFLNIVVRNMTKRQHGYLLALLFYIYVGLEMIPGCEVVMNYVSWFSVLYFSASYVRLYLNDFSAFSPKLSVMNRTWFWGFLTLLFVVLAVIDMLRHDGDWRHVSDANAIYAVLVSFSSFMCFKALRIPNSRIVNAIASTTFGVLLIHANSEAMRQWLWGDVVDCIGHYSQPLMPALVYAALSVAGVFVVCSLIDWVRIQTVEKWFFAYFDKHYSNAG